MADPTEADEAEPQESDQERNWRKLESRTKQAEEKAAQLERELAFTRAGLDHLSDKQVKALTAAHEGDITADALKATADELGFIPKPDAGESTPAPEGPDHSGEVAELAELSNSPRGYEGPSGPVTQEQHDAAIAKALNEGGPEAVQAYVMDHREEFGF